MCADRSLWVDDTYVLRCRGCNRPFTWLRRKHHCRQCGQVFCSNCLYSTPTSLSQLGSRVGVIAPPAAPPPQAEKHVFASTTATKVCHRCVRQLATTDTQNPSSTLSLDEEVPQGTAPIAMSSSSVASRQREVERDARLFTSPLTREPMTEPNRSSRDMARAPGESSDAPHSADREAPLLASTDSDAPLASTPQQTVEPSSHTAVPAHVTSCHLPPPPVAETDEERSVSMGLADPVTRRRSRLTDWLANITQRAAAEKDDAPTQQPTKVADTPLWSAPRRDGLLTYLGRAAGTMPEACSTFLPSASGAQPAAAEPPSHSGIGVISAVPSSPLTVWNKQCATILHSRIECIIQQLGLQPRLPAAEEITKATPAVTLQQLTELVAALAMNAVDSLVVPLGNRASSHVELLLSEDRTVGASEVLLGVAFFASPASHTMAFPKTLAHPRWLLLSGDVTVASEASVGVLEYMSTYRGHLDNNLKKIGRWKPDVIAVERGMHHYLQDELARQYPTVLLLLYVGRHQLERLAAATGACLVADLSFVNVSQLASSAETPLGISEQCYVSVVGKRVVCSASGFDTSACYATVLIRGIQDEPAHHTRWHELWQAALSTTYHLCAQAHLCHDAGLVLKQSEMTPPNGTQMWTLNVAVTYPAHIVEALRIAGPPRGTRDTLVVQQIEVGAIETTTAMLLTDNDDHSEGFPQRRSLRFYQKGEDESLCQFLLARAASEHPTVLFAHGTNIVNVTATTEERTMALGRYDCWATTEELKLFETVQSCSGASSVDAYLDLSPDSFASTVRTMRSPLCYVACPSCKHAKQDSVAHGEGDSRAEHSQRQQQVSLCSPHTLNISLGSFLEFITYGDFDAFACARCGNVPTLSTTGHPEWRFVLFPAGPAAVTITFRVLPLRVPPLRFPPRTLRPRSTVVSPCEDQEKAELVRDVNLLLDCTRAVAERCVPENGVPAELTSLLQGAAALQQHVNKLPHMTVADATTCRWTQLRSLLFMYNALLLKVPTARAAMPPNSAQGAPAQAVSASASAEVIAPHQWLYSPFVGRAIRWNEPTSLIALALAQLDEMRVLDQSGSHEMTSQSHALAALRYCAEGIATASPTRMHLADLHTASGQLLRPPSADAQFATVELYFPEAFRALSFLSTGGQSERVMESLWRCVRDQPAGGKSNSEFFRTVDGSFLLKRIRPIELRHFVGGAAQRYFRHVANFYAESGGADDDECEAHPHTSCAFGKVFGVCTIIRRPLASTGTSVVAEQEHYMLVENLVAQLSVHAAYDLKGSQRNRVAAAGTSVGLDENLVYQLRSGQFLFVSEPDKRELLTVLTADTALLVSSSIMDYSLMVAHATPLTSEAYIKTLPTATLSVGLIDYMQPYTGAKALESKMKSGFDTVLGYTNRAPTIIDPTRYQHRFLRWMDRYFCAVPNRLACTDEGDVGRLDSVVSAATPPPL